MTKQQNYILLAHTDNRQSTMLPEICNVNLVLRDGGFRCCAKIIYKLRKLQSPI